jgi:hypothetical protein
METQKRLRNFHTNEQELSAEDWRAKVERLQEIVCALLLENQAMRVQQNGGE